MCGIIGCVSNRPVAPILMDGLKRLEYRGYDSAGIVVLENGAFLSQKTAGKLKDLDALLKGQSFSGHIGIGHTRWATHGALDAGFGTAGVVTNNPSGLDDTIRGLAVDSTYIYAVGDDLSPGTTDSQWRIEKRLK